MSPRNMTLAIALVLAGQLAPQQAPVFEASVEQVRVDVIVTDADGRFVDDLQPGDFVVREDGREQEILAFQLVDLRAVDPGATGADPAARSREASDSAGGGESTPRDLAAPVVDGAAGAATAAPQSALGAMVFVIDFPGLDWRNKERFVNAWAELLDDTDVLAVPRAVYLIDQVGRLRELAPLTRDAAALRRAVQTVRDEPLVRSAIHEQLLGIGPAETADYDSRAAPSAAELRAGELNAPDGRVDERSRSLSTLQLLTRFCNALTVRRGRTALVWVTAGLQTMEGGPFAALDAAAWERSRADDTFGSDPTYKSGNMPFRHLTPDRRIVERQQKLQRAANSANVSIYTVDPTPQHEWRSIGTSAGVASASQGELLGGLTVQASLDGLRDTLRDAAAETGGRSFIGPSDLDRVIPEIEADSGRFYLLTYAAPPPLGDDEYHAITVEVSREGLNVRARRGYVDTPAAERAEQALEAALSVPGTVSGLAVRARVVRRWAADGVPIAQLIADIAGVLDGGSDAQSSTLSPLDVLAAVVDDEGVVAAELRQRVVPRGSGAVAPGAGDTSSVGDSAAPRSFVYVHEWSLEPGTYDVRIAVRDTGTGVLGATHVPLDVPAASAAWRAGDPLLLVVPAGATPQPLARYEIGADDELAIQMEVDNGERPVLSGELFSADGSELIAQLPPLAMQRDAGGIDRGVLRLRGMAPGSYTLQISITDAAAGKHAIQRVEVKVHAAG